MDETRLALGERYYFYEGALYLIRDVYTDGKFMGCEYATQGREKYMQWTPCREGGDFAEIKPFVTSRDMAAS